MVQVSWNVTFAAFSWIWISWSLVSVQPRRIPAVSLPEVLLKLSPEPFVCDPKPSSEKSTPLIRYQTSTTTKRPAVASLASQYADKCGIRPSGYRPDQVPMTKKWYENIVEYFLTSAPISFFLGLQQGQKSLEILPEICFFLLPASAAGSDHCARLAELWCRSTSCRIVPMVGESLSQVDIITRLMKAGTKTLAALHTIMTGWVGDSQFRILYTSRSQPEQQKDAKT